MQFLFHQLWSGQKVSFFPHMLFSCWCFHSCSSNASNRYCCYKILHLCSDFSNRKSAAMEYSRCSFCSTYFCERTKQLQLNPEWEEIKNSLPVVWGGKEEKEYPQIPIGFRGNMTLTLSRGAEAKMMLPTLRRMEPHPPGSWPRAAPASAGVSGEEHGMQRSRGLAHCGTLVTTPSY